MKLTNVCYEALTSMELKNINEISAFSFLYNTGKTLIHIEKLHTKKFTCDSELKYQSLNLKSGFNSRVCIYAYTCSQNITGFIVCFNPYYLTNFRGSYKTLLFLDKDTYL